MVWRRDDPQGDETSKIRWELPRYTRGIGLDVGCGRCKGYPHFIGVDISREHLQHKNSLDADLIVNDASRLPMFADKSLDFVYSSHMLEHVEDYQGTLREWWRIVKPGGYLVLYLPHEDFYPKVGQPGANPDHKHDFNPAKIEKTMEGLGSWDLVRNEERNQENEYSFFQVYKKLPSGSGHLHSYKKPRPTKTCGVVRYGGWGDAIQTSSVLPELKKLGYHVTMYVNERTFDVMQHDPHVDSFYQQDTDQVPNSHLGDFWAHEAKKYDKWINLSESVEATWLAVEGKGMFHGWPTSVRRKYLSKTNYVEFQHDVAEVPYNGSNQKFYPTISEKNWALDQKKRIGGDPMILWITNGSSQHKLWPHMDPIIARLMLTWPDVRVVMAGDPKRSHAIYAPWKAEPRVVSTIGEWTIRETLAFAEICDLVIGPETGVMSSVAMLKLPKIVFLSHSSHENLTRDWVNTFALFPTKTKCYPCNQLHYTWKHCNMNDDKGEGVYWGGTAQCQVDIPPQACWAAIMKIFEEKFPEVEDAEPVSAVN